MVAAVARPFAVTLITKDHTNPFCISMQKGAEEAGGKNGVTLTKAAGAKDGDEDGQVKAIEAAVARGDKGILIAPTREWRQRAIENAKSRPLCHRSGHTAGSCRHCRPHHRHRQFQSWRADRPVGGRHTERPEGDHRHARCVQRQGRHVDFNRDQGFLTGMGIDMADKAKNGDEAATGKYTGGKGGDYQIVCHEPSQGAQDEGKTGMESCLSKSKDINTVYTINEPTAAGAVEALQAAGIKDALVVSVDGGCSPGIAMVKEGTIGATSQQYPVKMAQMGVEALKQMVDSDGAEKPQNSPGLDFVDAGVALVTDKPVEGVESITAAEAEKICWGGNSSS